MLVGTEAVLHRVRRAAAVVFLDFDQHLLAPRFAAAEEALGPAGPGRPARRRPRRAPGAGTVLVQTRLPDHAVLAAAVARGPRPVSDERPLRRGARPAAVRGAGRVSGRRRPAAVLRRCRPDGSASMTADLGDGRWLAAGRRTTRRSATRWRRRRGPSGRLRVDRRPDRPIRQSAGRASPIRHYGDPVLRSGTREIEEIDGSVAKLVDDMIETMYDAPG